MQIKNDFGVHASIDQTWAVLTDLELIAPCMPGATLTGRDGEDYVGKVKVRVGPATSEFKGVARFSSVEPENYAAVITAEGRDTRGAGNASATVSASLTEDGDSLTTVHVLTDMQIAGKLAQFGSGMIQQVSEKLLVEFTRRLETVLDSNPDAGSRDDASSATLSSGATAADDPPAVAPDTARPAEAVSAENAPGPPAASPSRPAPEERVPGEPASAAAAAAPSFEEEPGIPANFTYVPEVPGEPYAYALPSDSAGHTTHWSARTRAPGPAAAAASEPASDAATTEAQDAPTSATAGDEDATAAATSVPATTERTDPSGAGEQASEDDSRATAEERNGTAARKVITFDDDDNEALDLMKYAGGSIAKRVVPVVIGIAVLVIIVLLMIYVW